MLANQSLAGRMQEETPCGCCIIARPHMFCKAADPSPLVLAGVAVGPLQHQLSFSSSPGRDAQPPLHPQSFALSRPFFLRCRVFQTYDSSQEVICVIFFLVQNPRD